MPSNCHQGASSEIQPQERKLTVSSPAQKLKSIFITMIIFIRIMIIISTLYRSVQSSTYFWPRGVTQQSEI